MVDVGSKPAASIAGLNLPVFLTSGPVTFAPGSKLYWMQTTPLDDSYTLWSDSQVGLWSSNIQTMLTSIDQLISAYQTGKTSGDKLWIDGNFVTFDAAAANSLTGVVTLWSDGISGCTPTGCRTASGMNPVTYTKTGSAVYEIKTILGQTLLIVKTDSPGKPGSNTIFAAQSGKLYTGRFDPVGVPQMASANFNKIGIESILSGYTAPAVVSSIPR